MLALFLGLLLSNFLRPSFAPVNLVIRTEKQQVFLLDDGHYRFTFPKAVSDIWDMNEEETISRHLYSKYGLGKGYDMESIHRFHGSTFAEILYTGSATLGCMRPVAICDFAFTNISAAVRSWVQNYGPQRYCKANQLSAPGISGFFGKV